MSLARRAWRDLTAARDAVRGGQQAASALLEQCLENARSADAEHAFVRLFDHQARTTAAATDAKRQVGMPLPPLAGLAVSIKDLFDVHGFATSAGSRLFADAPPATADAGTVARLRGAGAAFIGHTTMSEFAFSGVGINPHHGTPANLGTRALDSRARIPGGSTSGGATSVAAGAAWAALGSDTGGSIRIPAALQGLVGFKNTQRLTPLSGSVPLSFTLDTACAITLSVRDAMLLHEVLSGRPVPRFDRPVDQLRLAVPSTVMLDELDPTVATAFGRSLARLREQGAHIDELPTPTLTRMAGLQASGGFAAAEAWAWHRPHLARASHLYDPRVAMRIRRGEAISAADYIDLMHARTACIAEMQAVMAPYDAMLSPTVPMVAPLLDPLLNDDMAFFTANARLLRNPSMVNYLDGCALSLPCHQADELPVGLMVWAAALHDEQVLQTGLAIEKALAGRGA